MPQLIVLSDPIKCERREHVIQAGETVAHALVRLWPKGLNGSWRIYRDVVADDAEIPAVDLPYVVALDGERYLLVMGMAAGGFAAAFSAFMVDLAPAIIFQLAAMALMPKAPRHRPDDPDMVSANNMIAGQTNQLRPGARVPEILGKVRAWPDLLCAPVDVYNEAQQTIGQMFVLGRGAYDVPADGWKLGETPLTSIRAADLDVYPPGTEVPPFFVLKNSREVGDLSLLGGELGQIENVGEVDFIASSKVMRTTQLLTIGAGKPIRITDTFFNNGVYWVDSVPPMSQTTGPFDYVLDGVVVNELGANATITPFVEALQFQTGAAYGNAGAFDFGDTYPDDQRLQFGYQWPGDDMDPHAGDYIELLATSGERYRGYITSAMAFPRSLAWQITMNDLQNNPVIFPSMKRATNFRTFRPPEAPESGATPGINANTPSSWYAAPMDDPQEIWLDFAFPQGLAWYDKGSRRTLRVAIKAEFRRAGATSAQASQTFEFPYSTNTPLRFTRRVAVSALIAQGLPAGGGTIEVRTMRTTQFFTDDQNNQYLQDTRWQRLAAVREIVGQSYPDVTVMQLTLSNNRSTTAVNDLQLNVMATRILPSWDGAAWTAPAPTRKWADHFVARCLASDGARRPESQVDLASIYAIQAQLDAMDLGKQGEISLTLDVIQDIDTELAQVADVVRAVVFRVGRKIVCARDQENANAIALFNARNKGPDGESVAVRMTADADNDCVVVTWVDENLGWKQRDYQYPEDALATNPLRVGAVCANWEQVRRRAVYEWNRLKYRRKQITVAVTEDGRIVRPGDVINVTDDLANMATCAGEVLAISGATLTLDRDLVLGGASSFLVLLRDQAGVSVDLVPCTPAGANQVTLARPPIVAIKGRDNALGSLFAFYPVDDANVDPWLVVGTQVAGPFVTINAQNYSAKVYDGDSAPMPPRPPPNPTEVPTPPNVVTINALSSTNTNSGDVTATYRLTSGGDVFAQTGTGGLDDVADWLTPKSGMGAYSARATPMSGTAPAGAALNTWLNLGTSREWHIGGSSFNYSGFLVEIRLDETGVVLDSAVISLQVH